jgi:hypothetical protein
MPLTSCCHAYNVLVLTNLTLIALAASLSIRTRLCRVGHHAAAAPALRRFQRGQPHHRRSRPRSSRRHPLRRAGRLPPAHVIIYHTIILTAWSQVGYPPILLNNPDRLFVVLKESALSMLLIVLSSLQSDMLPSTWSGCISRMHEIFPVPQPLRFMPEHLSQFVQLSESGVQIDRNSRGERILLPQGVSAWECIDPNDPSDPYSEQVCNYCTVIVTFLLNTIRTVVKTGPALVLISLQVWAAVDEFLRASPKLRTPVSGRCLHTFSFSLDFALHLMF